MEPAAGAAATLTLDDATAPVSVRRVRQAVAAAALVAIAFSQQPGRIVGDTKLDLVVAPATFLGRSLSAWDPHAAFGQLQNQAYGYLFPMGPFFLLGHLMHVPAWVVQRAWWSVLLVLAFAGCLRVARLLDAGTPTSRMVAAFAYALSPRVLTVLGGISVEALPLALLPWVLAPLIRGAQGGSARRAAMRSGLAVACIGGVNAAATLAVLPLPAIYLLTRARGPRRAALIRWWVTAVVLATLWWVLPLLVLSRYAFPFLNYIESASVTTSVDSLTNVVRGTSHWLAYLPVHGHPFWPAGWQLATGSLGIVATVAVAAAGLAGLTAPRVRERRFLLLGVVVGVVLMSVGYAGALSSPLSPLVRQMLDGPLAAFRNVHKFDPIVRLPIAIGLCYVASALPRPAIEWRHAPRVLGTLAAVLLLGATTPAVQGRLAPDGAFEQVPDYWRAAARYVDHGPLGGRTLLVPASRFAEYDWGRPMDEPLGALSSGPWAVRDAVPLGAPGATRLLDAVNQRMASGAGSASLAPALAQAGIRYVLLRNDIDTSRSGALPPELFRSTLMESPGLRRAAAFGPRLETLSGPGARALEVFEVAAPADGAVVYPTSAVDLMSGGPEAALPLADLGLGDATVAVADASGLPARAVIVTDTLRRRSLNFGADAGSSYSPTLAADVDPARGRSVADVLPYDGVTHQTVSALVGARAVTASSSAADPYALLYRGPQARPESAVDGHLGTAWVSDARPVGQWLQLDLQRAVRAPAVRVRVVNDPSIGPAVTQLEVRTDTGVRIDPVRPTSDAQLLPLPPGPTRTLRLTVRRVADNSVPGAVGITELAVPGVSVHQTLVPPRDAEPRTASGAPTAYVFARADGYRGNCYRSDASWTCVPGLAQPGEEIVALDRTFTLPRTTADAIVLVRPREGPALDRLLDSALGFRASASSRLVGDPAARPGAAFDGDPTTAWISAEGDVNPELRLQLRRSSTVHSLDLTGANTDLRRIRRVVVRTGNQFRVLAYRPGQHLSFPPLTGRAFTVEFAVTADQVGVPPLRVAEVSLGGLPTVAGGQVVLPCGSGPTVTVDGQVHRTSLRQPTDGLLGLAPVRATLCDAPWSLQGVRHRLVGGSTDAFEVVDVALGDPSAIQGSAPGTTRAVHVSRWDPEARVVTVMPGPAGYLALAEGANRGWRAEANGRVLRPVRLDGWRQGWLLPAASSPVRISLTFVPGRWHRIGLLVGGLALLALLVGLVLPDRRAVAVPVADRAEHPARADGRDARRDSVVAALVVGALAVVLIGPWGLVLLPPALALPASWRPAFVGAALVVAAISAAVLGTTSGVPQLFCAGAVIASACCVAPRGSDFPLRRLEPRSSRGRSSARHDTEATASVASAVKNETPRK